ncbi:hypothetical protein QN277_006410 [Acacia crassicarpa]|uniref:Reverse transcriptase domain-containing protein n=1 Tax=Acacia crassicarpa TaxID=499986 RepID=A0AAE1IUW4_9FABA|nr:hypothetical protein QN277_006410 [Acacia crassicarpa]
MAIKVDLEKAFDRLRWNFVEDTLQDVGLPTAMSRLIMNCIRTPTMQVLWNGKPSVSFTPQRGIRQDDPLSAYIFVLCMECLSQTIQVAINEGEWNPLRWGVGEFL